MVIFKLKGSPYITPIYMYQVIFDSASEGGVSQLLDVDLGGSVNFHLFGWGGQSTFQ